jgi:hypothetical protein
VTAYFALYPLTWPAEGRPVSARFDEGAAVFARAERAYAQGRCAEAAELFLDAADLLVLGGPYAAAFTVGRTVSYWNAILANLAAGDRASARRVARDVEEQDPECLQSVAELMSRLGLHASG